MLQCSFVSEEHSVVDGISTPNSRLPLTILRSSKNRTTSISLRIGVYGAGSAKKVPSPVDLKKVELSEVDHSIFRFPFDPLVFLDNGNGTETLHRQIRFDVAVGTSAEAVSGAVAAGAGEAGEVGLMVQVALWQSHVEACSGLLGWSGAAGN